jgi:hypothetical protein
MTGVAGSRCARLRPPEISVSHGAEWKALISTYIKAMPASGGPCPAGRIISIPPPPRTPVINAMIANAGVAARQSHLAMPGASAARSSSRLVPLVELS